MPQKIKLGPYILGETLGVGSFGKVKVATHELTGYKVGVKILNRNKIASLDMVQKIRREIQYLKALRHPHIIKLYEVISTPTDIFMIMEYVSGGELFDFIVKNGKISESEARRFFQQIICAVEYCHRHNIVHRDLKPENLLLDNQGNIKIADFGLSNIMTDGDFLKTSCGSPNYAAPEVVSGKLYAGAEVDVWSCGVILYTLLCGRLPFDDEHIPTLFKRIKGGIFTIPPFLSSQTRDLLLSMLVVDPLKRITIPEIRQNPWFNISLPDYLKPIGESGIVSPNRLDDEVVEELAMKMDMERQHLYNILSMPGESHAKVAYNLMLDNKLVDDSGEDQDATALDINRYYTRSVNIPVTTRTLSSHNEGVGSDADEEEEEEGVHAADMVSPSSIAMLSTSIRGGLTFGDEQIVQEKKKKKRSKWHLGIRSRSRPHDVMSEVFLAMKKLNMDWKLTESQYNAIGRYKHPSGRIVLVALQLYKVDDRNYLLDFKSLPSPGTSSFALFDFLTVCSKLITELAIA